MEGVRVRRKHRPSPPASGWTIGYALGALAVSVVVAVVLVLLLSHQELRLGVGVLAFDAVMLAALIPLRRKRPFRLSALGLRPAPPARSVGFVVLAVIAVGIVNAGWLHGVLGLKQPSSLGIHLHESTAGEVLTGFALALCAPVSEEIFFRGLLYRAFRNRLTVAPAALLNGLIFAAVHGITYPLDTLPPRLAFGIITCLLYEYTGSLYPGIALHCLIDAAGFEAAITGRGDIVFLVFAAIGATVLLYAGIRTLQRRRSPTATSGRVRPPQTGCGRSDGASLLGPSHAR